MRNLVASTSVVLLVGSVFLAACSTAPPKPADSPDPGSEGEPSSRSSPSSKRSQSSDGDADLEPAARRSAPSEAPDPKGKGKKDDAAPTTKKAIPMHVAGGWPRW